MQKKIIWYIVQLKMILKSWGLYLQLAAMAGIVILIGSINIPDGKNMNAGIYLGNTEYGRAIADDIMSMDSVFNFSIYDDNQSMVEDVGQGKLECGFVFGDDFDKKFENGNAKELIGYICSTDTTKGAVIKENVYSTFLKSYSRILLKESNEKIFDSADEKRLREMLRKNDEFLDSSLLFSTDMIELESRQETETVSKANPIRGIIIFFVFLIMYLYAGNSWSDNGRVKAALSRGNQFWFDFMGELAAGTIPLCAMFLLFTWTGSWYGKTDILKIFIFIIYSAVWITILMHFIKSRISYYSSIVVMMICFLFLCPVFVDLEQYVPAIRYIRILIPTGIF